MHKLIITGTPIGNLDDITFRALKTILTAQSIVAEDTRNYLKLKKLLIERYKNFINTENIFIVEKQNLISYREETHSTSINKILEELKITDVVLVSDAGMPLISDPGNKLISDLYNLQIEIDVVPGTSAFLSALVLSGFNLSTFKFIGFLPKSKNKIFQKITKKTEIVVFYESPFRVLKTLKIIDSMFPESEVTIVKEITKKFQEITRGKIKDVINALSVTKIQGEFTIVLYKKNGF